MYGLNLRDIIQFNTTGNNTYIADKYFNFTTLSQWNYTLYSNNTLSNESTCVLTFEPFTPYLLSNGSFLNSTSCYTAQYSIGKRGILGLVVSCLCGLSIMFTFVNLRKHGRLFLPSEKRFRAIGRRWQWYWMLAVAASGMISGITGVDVDRYYLPEIPIVLYNFFWFLCLPMTLAVVWESVRHWGSWQERQLIDPNPFVLKQDDKRGKREFYMPLVFYLFTFLNFFMVVPRSWTAVEYQRYAGQAEAEAAPMATDVRFKIAAFLLFLGWCVTVYSLWHSIHHYKPRNRGLINRSIGLVRYTPNRFILTLALSLIMIGYEAAISFNFDISPMKIDASNANLPWMFGLGWVPILLILFIQEVSGYLLPNEDRELVRQRRVRGAEIDQELGFTKKPHWWSRLNGDHNMSVHQAIAKNVREVGGGAATTRNLESAIEMGNMPASKKNANRSSTRPESLVQVGNNPVHRAMANREARKSASEAAAVQAAAGLLFPVAKNIAEGKDPFADSKSLGSTASDRGRLIGEQSSGVSRDATSERSPSTGSTGTMGTLNAPPQKIKSMLDI